MDSSEPSGSPAWVPETTHGHGAAPSASGSTPGHSAASSAPGLPCHTPQGWAHTQASLLVYRNNEAPQGPPLCTVSPDHTHGLSPVLWKEKQGCPSPPARPTTGPAPATHMPHKCRHSQSTVQTHHRGREMAGQQSHEAQSLEKPGVESSLLNAESQRLLCSPTRSGLSAPPVPWRGPPLIPL